jgi:hypothetical protein
MTWSELSKSPAKNIFQNPSSILTRRLFALLTRFYPGGIITFAL